MLSRRPARFAAVPRGFGAPAGVCVGVLLAIGSSEAGAAAVGPAVTSAGLMAVVAMLVLLQGWPVHLPAVALSGAAALMLAGAAAWLWRTRAPQRWLSPASTLLAPGVGSARSLATPAARPTRPALPAGLDAAELLAELRAQFVQLQAAWDVRDIQTLRALTTPQMLEEFCFEWPGSTLPCGPTRTDVLTLDAVLLGFEELAGTRLASIEFSGLIREAADQGATPFRELWMLAKSNDDGARWKLARHQALL